MMVTVTHGDDDNEDDLYVCIAMQRIRDNNGMLLDIKPTTMGLNHQDLLGFLAKQDVALKNYT
ncbi:hypothetical protein E2C01_026255 [Portunus trituberculatus]|uniref:Uncharacterized protein n=1 Tax=Portunus trituberculatus TaxID=210409 RepID=A0A5B7EF76_PORTR|nr:hypothetical protein [Portunus trituberculatus]